MRSGNSTPGDLGGGPLFAGALHGWTPHPPAPPYVVGVLRGEGVGPEVVDVALELLDVVAETLDLTFDVREGGPIGLPALRASGRALTGEVGAFCEGIFRDGGALLCGPGGGRFVYELRRQFDLYTKLTPIEPSAALRALGPLCPEARDGVRMVIVRENTGGVYQGDWAPATSPKDEATHRFGYTRAQTERILRVALALGRKRRGRVAVVTKPGGVPSVSALWKTTAASLEEEYDLEVDHLEVDNAAYQLIASAPAFDVVVAPNLFGDILGDAASLLLGSRGLSYSGNFGAAGRAVYQTAHGAAHDLAGLDRANPLGQIYSLAMMLRESFGLLEVCQAIHAAVERVLEEGLGTADLEREGTRVVGTRALGRHVASALATELDRTVTMR